jgi:Domain of unknown function (DUF3883)
LDKKYDGKSIYFPFQIPKEKVIQPAQGAYLSKMPKALVELFPAAVQQLGQDIAPEISYMKSPITSKLVTYKPTNPKPPAESSYGIQTDEKKKKATELRGMALATKYLEMLGYSVEDVSSQKRLRYDLRAVKDEEVVGVEVKASIMSRIEVAVTTAEVEYAKLQAKNSVRFYMWWTKLLAPRTEMNTRLLADVKDFGGIGILTQTRLRQLITGSHFQHLDIKYLAFLIWFGHLCD